MSQDRPLAVAVRGARHDELGAGEGVQLVATADPDVRPAIAVCDPADAPAAFAALGRDEVDDVAVRPLAPGELVARARAVGARVAARAGDVELFAHDVNNHLAHIRLVADLLAQEPGLMAHARDLRSLAAAGDTASSLVQGLVAFTAMDLPAREPSVDCALHDVLRAELRRPAFAAVRVDEVQDVTVHAAPSDLRWGVVGAIACALALVERGGEVRCALRGDLGAAVLTLDVTGVPYDAALREQLLARHGAPALRELGRRAPTGGLAGPAALFGRSGGRLVVSGGPDGPRVRVVFAA